MQRFHVNKPETRINPRELQTGSFIIHPVKFLAMVIESLRYLRNRAARRYMRPRPRARKKTESTHLCVIGTAERARSLRANFTHFERHAPTLVYSGALCRGCRSQSNERYARMADTERTGRLQCREKLTRQPRAAPRDGHLAIQRVLRPCVSANHRQSPPITEVSPGSDFLACRFSHRAGARRGAPPETGGMVQA